MTIDYNKRAQITLEKFFSEITVQNRRKSAQNNYKSLQGKPYSKGFKIKNFKLDEQTDRIITEQDRNIADKDDFKTCQIKANNNINDN